MSFTLWRGLMVDFRDALRSLASRPTFTIASALLTAIGVASIGSAGAIVYGILWRPLPYPDPEALAVIWQISGGERTQVSLPDYQDLAASAAFESATVLSGGRGSLRVNDRIERVNALAIEAAGLAMLGARPLVGRLLSAEDADRPLAMISHRLWSTHLNFDPRIVGRVIWLSGEEYTVVGVLQPDVDFELPVPPTFMLEDNDVWTIFGRSSPFLTRRDVTTFEVLVRLAPGTSLREGQSALDAIATRLAQQHPATNTGRSFQLVPLKDDIVASVRRPLLFVTLAAFITLAVTLANLLTLSLARGIGRQAELSVRAALGAGTWRLRRQLFTEFALLAGMGAAAGGLVAHQLVRWLVQSEAAQLPRPDAIRLDAPVLLLIAGAALAIAVVLTVQPLPFGDLLTRGGMRLAGSPARGRRRVLVSAEIALAVTLTTGGALLALSFGRLLATDVGFEARGAAAARVSAYEAEYRSRDEVVRFFHDVIDRVRDSPDVESAAAGSSLPLSGQFAGTSVVAEQHAVMPAERPTAGWQFITPGYFTATGMRLVEGRDFSDADRDRGAHVTIINQSLARMLFPGERALGRRIGVGGGDAQGDWHEIIGIVADVKHQALDTAPAPRVYDLFGQHWGRTLYVVARSRVNEPEPLISVMRRQVNSVNMDVPVFESTTLPALIDRSAATRRLAARIASGLAGAGLMLALIGVYAIGAASVAERRRELGVRAALGANPRDLFQLVAGEGTRTIAWGAVAGIFASAAVSRLLASHLFEVDSADAIWVVAVVAVLVAATSLIAAIPPSRRAAGAEPLVAMRTD
jgi:putative ABC transport system permease protein